MNSQITKKNLMQDFAVYLLPWQCNVLSADKTPHCGSATRYCVNVTSYCGSATRYCADKTPYCGSANGYFANETC